MRKAFCIFLVLFPLISGIAWAQRGPSVSPITEISAEQDPQLPAGQSTGFNFSNKQVDQVSTQETGSDGSIVPMMLFLMALPVMIWIGIMQGLRVTRRSKNVLPDNITQFPSRKKNDDKDHFKKAS